MFAIFSSDGTSLTIPLPAVIVNGVHVDPDNWPITNDPAIVLSSHPSASKTITKRSDGNFEVTWTGLSPALTHGQIVRITIDGEIDSVAWSTVELYVQVLHYPPKLSAYTDARGGYLDKLDVTGALAHSDAANTYKADLTDVLSHLPESGRAGTAAEIEAALVNEGDATALLQAIADKIASDLTAGDLTALAIVTAIKSDATLAQMIARIDGTISSRATPADVSPTIDFNPTINPTELASDSVNAIRSGLATSQNVTDAQTAIIEHGDENWANSGEGEAPNITTSSTHISSQ